MNRRRATGHSVSSVRTCAFGSAGPSKGAWCRYRVDAVAEETIIREFRSDDLGAIVEFSLRAWEPVFGSVRNVLGDDIFLRLPRLEGGPGRRGAIRARTRNGMCSSVTDGRPVGFVAVALNAFHEGMGVIDIIGVDPDFQRRGISSRLTEFATEHMRSRGMDIAVVETGGDPGHQPARAAYQAAGFTLLPVARYFRLLD